MTEASKKTRSLGQVQGLFGGRRLSWHMFSIEVSSHHAVAMLMVPAMMVPAHCTMNIDLGGIFM